MSEPIENIEELPFAWFYEDDDIKWCSFDKNHLPNGAIPLYTHPQKELSEKEIIDTWKKFPNWGNEQHILMFAKELLKKASEK